MEEITQRKISQPANEPEKLEQQNADTKYLTELLTLHQNMINRLNGSKSSPKLHYPSIFRALIGVCGKNFLLSGIFRLSFDILTFIPTLLLG